MPAIGAPRQWSLDGYLEGYEKCRREIVAKAIGSSIPLDTVAAMMDRECPKAGERRVLAYGLPSWEVIRRLIYDRDGGVCWACGVPTAWEHFELGHLVDRCAGGLDIPENLAVMCILCNRIAKPVHLTLADAERWRDETRGIRGVMELCAS
jgi:5-methylcytosine-specific restriction endonuclease McrA